MDGSPSILRPASVLATPPHQTRQPCLYIDAQHGLSNRLRAVASAAGIAARTGRQLVVIWQPDHHCEARIGDVISYDGPVVDTAGDAREFRDSAAAVYNYMEIEPDSDFQAAILPAGSDHPGQDIYVRSAYVLNSPYSDPAYDRRFLRALRPAPEVMELVNRVPHPSAIAAHIRMATGAGYDHLSFEGPDNWPADRHAELTEWRRKSDVSRFVARLDALIAEGRGETIFIAADLPETYAELVDLYGSRVRYLHRERYDRSVRQVQYALADLLLLTAAPHFLASTWSAFSDLARMLGRRGRRIEQSGRDF